jgi:quercetin dioxygenase-like cupin family protein
MSRLHLIPAFMVLLALPGTYAGAQTPTTQTPPPQSSAARSANTQASAQPPILRKQLMLAHFAPRPISRVDIREINLAPGQKGPLHKHPCPVVGYIVSGTIYFQVKGDSARILGAGDPFYEPAGTVITHFDNASPAVPAKFVLNYLMNTEKQFIILLDDKEQEIKAN